MDCGPGGGEIRIRRDCKECYPAARDLLALTNTLRLHAEYCQ